MHDVSILFTSTRFILVAGYIYIILIKYCKNIILCCIDTFIYATTGLKLGPKGPSMGHYESTCGQQIEHSRLWIPPKGIS